MLQSPTTLKQWEEYGDNVHRMKVEGGYLYNSVKGLVFVPDVKVDMTGLTTVDRIVSWSPHRKRL
jgi:hypothetical protein